MHTVIVMNKFFAGLTPLGAIFFFWNMEILTIRVMKETNHE